MPYDVVIVGAGPAGLSAAIRLKQLANEAGSELSVCILEKGSEVGAHILSGAVIDPKSLDELLPEWRTQGCPMAEVLVNDNQHWVLTKTKKLGVPHIITPGFMHNKGTYTGSLGNLCRWLAEQAEGLGVEIFPGFPAAEILYNEDGSVKGVATGDMGVARDGSHKGDYAPGLELHAKYTFFGEGVRGHLTKILKPQFALDAECEPQVYGLGVKELWDVKPENHAEGRVIHTQGWPLDEHANGGGFLYHQANGQVALGFVTWLNYRNPHISPFQEMQKWKTHPEIAKILKGGKRVSYGARAISDGGYQSVPKLAFPGGLLIGCTAGFMNVPKIKGVHQAIRSGVLAAEHVAETGGTAGFDAKWRASPGGQELRKVRNFKPGFKKGLWGGIAVGALETVTGGRLPYTLHNRADGPALKPLDSFVSPERGWSAERELKPRDRLSAVFYASTQHDEAQPAHLKVLDTSVCVTRCAEEFGNPCQNFCPAHVYEIVKDEASGAKRLQINAANCVHCKACDIKDPYGIINWTTPEGGSGPNYPNL